MWKSKKHVALTAQLACILTALVALAWHAPGGIWNRWDYQAIDGLYRRAIEAGHGPPSSPRVATLALTDDTYRYFGNKFIDRSDLAKVNEALAKLHPAAVIYDIIFARAGQTEENLRFVESLKLLPRVYLPSAFNLSDHPPTTDWSQTARFENLKELTGKILSESGKASPFYAARPLLQEEPLALFSTGHINMVHDPDGVFRHLPLLIRAGPGYMPALSLNVFLDAHRIPWSQVKIHWGENLLIPALPGGDLNSAMAVPIDHRGRAFVPFTRTPDAREMSVHRFLELFKNEDMRGNLSDFFEDAFVVISDISQGVSDVGQTTLDDTVSLAELHRAMLNGLLTGTFYREQTRIEALAFLAVAAVFLAFTASLKWNWALYAGGLFSMASLAGWTWHRLLHFELVPVVSLAGGIAVVLAGLAAGVQATLARDQKFIRTAFSRYVPESVVTRLLAQPQLLQLGGEERRLTVLFSDLEGFTTFSENMKPAELVDLLNQYLTEMTQIVLSEGGIIDKFQGDAIMAEFGLPLPVADHADRAVRAALGMQRRLRELRPQWEARKLPPLRCRIGINTGNMLAGNMGSRQIFDYTVIGDAVNLASRLEGVNKYYGTNLMISEHTLEALSPGSFRTRILDVIKVKGKSRAVKIFEVCGETPETAEASELHYAETYQHAFEAYLSRDFAGARRGFEKALELRPGDLAARELLRRLDGLDPASLGDDWDGSVALTAK